jgi:hypothetical protein
MSITDIQIRNLYCCSEREGSAMIAGLLLRFLLAANNHFFQTVHENFHFTVNADGTVTANIDNLSAECK